MGTINKWSRGSVLETATQLTPAELKTYDLAQLGLSRKEIAEAMGVKLGTVNERMTILMQKLRSQEHDR